jgi:hypothetical protein
LAEITLFELDLATTFLKSTSSFDKFSVKGSVPAICLIDEKSIEH